MIFSIRIRSDLYSKHLALTGIVFCIICIGLHFTFSKSSCEYCVLLKSKMLSVNKTYCMTFKKCSASRNGLRYLPENVRNYISKHIQSSAPETVDSSQMEVRCIWQRISMYQRAAGSPEFLKTPHQSVS